MPDKLVTVAETPIFVRQSDEVWTEAEHDEFVLHIAGNPEAGVVIRKPAACAKSGGVGLGAANAAFA